ncbi:phosphoglycolate phosphatase [Thioalkalivibrio thiocyanodenitrificans]|uniref:phosphoglycolate phosphatase n=1 Tax=Thioalkalivibrio thiocyanodenitrificans TaxID=243063 RepID=UPI00035EAD3B|nr:phosphoglycolate phosphatase [Thioalkalivibrio thiocyanodenitrificans]
MSLARPKMVLIDLDGTLVDSVPDLAWCVDAMMRELGLPERGEPAVRKWVGNGVERLVQRALINAVDGEADEAEFRRALPVFMRLYRENTSGRSLLYPGVREGLDYLQRSGVRMGCVTNKAEQFTMPLLRDMAIRDYFELVVSGDTLPLKKPDPAPLLYAAEHLGVTPEESLMVGDSRSDVKAARAAGFTIVCVSYGYNHGEDIRNQGPDAVIDRLDQIQGLLEEAA